MDSDSLHTLGKFLGFALVGLFWPVALGLCLWVVRRWFPRAEKWLFSSIFTSARAAALGLLKPSTAWWLTAPMGAVIRRLANFFLRRRSGQPLSAEVRSGLPDQRQQDRS